ncbi:RmlC-like cupin [Rhizodiscina lignyota]|uniref:RmlC-like cupin n=1 Tax=Rhizodiscina lignyota TaxID=1504668 RepID=A0A9P4IN32_9PEZI|nr:RmlC-like cupin [Rhizodiscina lignyota]
MSPTIAKILLAALAATAVQAAPQMKPAGPAAAAPAPNANADLLKELALTSTAVERFQTLLVGDDGELLEGEALRARTVFDFKKAAKPNPGAKGGATAGADVSSFPILKDLGISTTLGFLDACGMNTAHVHPRATEMLTVVEGEIDTGMILENKILAPGKGTGEVTTHLKKFQGTVFPQGSIHYQVNTECHPAVFVANLNAEDPGTNQIAQGFFGLDADVVEATLGFPRHIDGKDIEKFRAQIPANVALGIEQCLRKCKIPKNKW